MAVNITARIWLLQALHDLDMAEKNLTISGYDVAAFLSHQAVEKLLKALLAARGEIFITLMSLARNWGWINRYE